MTEGFCALAVMDYDKELSIVQFRGTPLTSANFSAQATARSELQDAVAGICLGVVQRHAYGVHYVLPVLAATDPKAQRELKWSVSYHDLTTLRRYTLTVPCANTDKLDPNVRDRALLTDLAIATFIAKFEAYQRSPDLNAVKVDRINLVGRPV